MRPTNMDEIVNRVRYRTETATLIASDAYWDGSNYERRGRNTFLFRTPKGSFFLQHQTQWQGERDTIEPITRREAMEQYEALPERELTYQEAFDEEPEEA